MFSFYSLHAVLFLCFMYSLTISQFAVYKVDTYNNIQDDQGNTSHWWTDVHLQEKKTGSLIC